MAAAVDLDGDTVRDARIVLGGVAHKPWRAVDAENVLRGQPLTDEVLKRVGAAAVAGAKGYEHNAFKIELAQRAVARALQTAGGMA